MTVDGRLGMVPLELSAGSRRPLVNGLSHAARLPPTLDRPANRRELLDTLVNAGYSPHVVRLLEDMNDYDLFDVFAELGYGLAPRTAPTGHLPSATSRRIGSAYCRRPLVPPCSPSPTIRQGGTDDLENVYIFQTPEVKKAGGVAALAQGGDPAKGHP